MTTDQKKEESEPQVPFFWNAISILGIVLTVLLIVMMLH